ncbi:MAG: DNA polymerase III subunit delta', partial [Betaproteobacteria bacterium]
MDNDDEIDSVAQRFEFPALLPWQTEPLGAWLAQRVSWHHATLLHGQAGFGSRRLALHLAQGLLCVTAGAVGACGHCDACRLFAAGTHPDFRLVEREFDEKSLRSADPRKREAIVVEQVRALIGNFVYLTSHLGAAKVVVICLAEEMNAAAANALLKSLEEPPPGTFFILVSHQPKRLAPTVISRCRQLSSPRPSAADAGKWLRAQGATDPAALLAQAGGAPLLALTMLGDDYQAERTRFLQRLIDPRRLSVIALGAEVETGGRAIRKARMQQWFDLLATWSFDVAACARGLPPRYHTDFAKPLALLAATVAPRRILRYHRALL